MKQKTHNPNYGKEVNAVLKTLKARRNHPPKVVRSLYDSMKRKQDYELRCKRTHLRALAGCGKITQHDFNQLQMIEQSLGCGYTDEPAHLLIAKIEKPVKQTKKPDSEVTKPRPLPKASKRPRSERFQSKRVFIIRNTVKRL